MTHFLVDTNILIRFLRNDDAQQSERARSLMSRAASGDAVLWVTDVVLAECVWVLVNGYKQPSVNVADVLKRLLAKPGIRTDDPQLLLAALDHVALKGVDFADALLAARAARDHLTVASFDLDFTKFPDVTL